MGVEITGSSPRTSRPRPAAASRYADALATVEELAGRRDVIGERQPADSAARALDARKHERTLPDRAASKNDETSGSVRVA